jgi:hypothetical protein
MVLRISILPRFRGREISQQSKWPAIYKWDFLIFSLTRSSPNFSKFRAISHKNWEVFEPEAIHFPERLPTADSVEKTS